MNTSIRPAHLWVALALVAIAGGTHQALLMSNPASRTLQDWAYACVPSHVLAYGIALYYALRIGADHRAPSAMRTAWLLMAASAAVAIIRHVFDWVAYLAGWKETMLTTLVSLRQIPIVLSLLLLTAGLAAMWSSFAAIGMGLRLRFGDIAWLIVILACVPMIFSLRAVMSDAQSAYTLMRHLQSASPILLAAPALLALMLHRISQEMGGGSLAVSLRFLVAFLVTRLVGLLSGLGPWVENIPAVAVLTQAVNWSAPWIFTLALVYRWRVTAFASEMADRYAVDPESEIAQLSQGLAQAAGEQRK
jgi:hypothetical protein